MKKLPQKYIIPLIASIAFILVCLGIYFFGPKNTSQNTAKIKPTPRPAPINIIPISDRPFLELKPLNSRNELAITIQKPPLNANTVEATLEYDRNKGVLDAVLQNFSLDSYPFSNNLFLGSKSTGGHITYHEDVIGGDIILKFDGGDKPFALKVPWRYDDTKTEYSEFSTRDGMFQLAFSAPWKTSKLLIMQSPGLPIKLEKEPILMPYLIRGVGELPSLNVNITARVSGHEAATLWGFDGKTWTKIESVFENHTLSATSPLYSVFAISE